MWSDIDPETLSVVSDLSVGLDHIPQRLFDEANGMQFHDSPIATYPMPDDSSFPAPSDSDVVNAVNPASVFGPLVKETHIAEEIRERAVNDATDVETPPRRWPRRFLFTR